MILADTNIWLALSLTGHAFHPAARDWFGKQSVDHSVLFCRSTQQSLLRLITTDAVMRAHGTRPMTNAEAWAHFQSLRGHRRIDFLSETTGLERQWRKLSDRNSASPKIWMDSYLAALAITTGNQLITIDKAFSQYNGLDVIILEKA